MGRCVPIVRGEGVYQKGVDFCIEKLAENQWVHIFPEGKVTPTPIRIKWGVARMVSYKVVICYFSLSRMHSFVITTLTNDPSDFSNVSLLYLGYTQQNVFVSEMYKCVNFQIMESPNPPILLPIWIHQMAEVWPQSKPYYPRVGKVINMILQSVSLYLNFEFFLFRQVLW